MFHDLDVCPLSCKLLYNFKNSDVALVGCVIIIDLMASEWK